MKSGYHHGDLKNALVEAGIDIIIRDGIDQLSIRNAAKKIGVSHTAPYRHFKSKEELLVAIAIHGFHLLIDEMDRVIEKHGDDYQSQLQEAGRAYIHFAMDNTVYFRIMFGDYIKNKTSYPELFSVYDQAFRKTVDIIVKYSSKKKNRDAMPDITALAAWSLVHGYASLIIDNGTDATVGSEGQIRQIVKKMLSLV